MSTFNLSRHKCKGSLPTNILYNHSHFLTVITDKRSGFKARPPVGISSKALSGKMILFPVSCHGWHTDA